MKYFSNVAKAENGVNHNLTDYMLSVTGTENQVQTPVVCSVLPAKFLRHVKYDPSGCWIWIGSIGFHPKYRNHRYGQVKVAIPGTDRRYTTSAHRRAYELANGHDVPDEIDVDHICENKLCVNPDHLQLLSRSDNCKKRRGGR